MADDELEKIPNLDVAQLLFELSLPGIDKQEAHNKLIEHIKEDGMVISSRFLLSYSILTLVLRRPLELVSHTPSDTSVLNSLCARVCAHLFNTHF